MIHLDDDEHTDSYFPLEQMTVFGFGRGSSGDTRTDDELRSTPNRFLIGFAESAKFERVTETMNSLGEALGATIGELERRSAR